MGEVVNLRAARKARARSARAAEADANRVLHGTPKAERRRIEAERDATQRRLEGHCLEKTGAEEPDTGQAK